MLINPIDNVQVNLKDGHKYAVRDIKRGENVIKYGMPIGHATEDIAKGSAVHTHNMRTNLDGILEYTYTPSECSVKPAESIPTFKGYIRADGEVGIRNDIWIVNTVGCVNKISERLSRLTGAKAITHPYGCSQLGGDHEFTQLILRGLVNHPNAGGVLVLGLGCENNRISSFKKVLGPYDPDRVKFLECQGCEDEISEGVALIEQLKSYAARAVRTDIPVSRLKVGLKCGGSDSLSGITANPTVGRVSDTLASYGASTVMTEVPEMFGAETLLMKRCSSREVFDKTVRLINGFKEYFARHGQPVYENPSPGNKEGGITTLEEKSLGCVQKGGVGAVNDVLFCGDTVKAAGLSLLNGPGNDICAITNLTAAGAHLILFTTGRGTPLGAPIPTVKISTNASLSQRKSHWIDFDASCALDSIDGAADALLALILEVANGAPTKNEALGYEEIAIFHDGVTL